MTVSPNYPSRTNPATKPECEKAPPGRSNGYQRREFLKQGVLVLAGVTAGVLTNFSCASSPRVSGVTQPPDVPGALMSNAVASFGWEVANLHNNGADVYFKVAKSMILNSVNIDASFMITALSPAGFSEVLSQGSVSRGAPPDFKSSTPAAYIPPVLTSDFGPVSVVNNNGLEIGLDTNVYQDKFYSVILKAWVPDSGAGGSASRHVQSFPALSINAGDYLVFHLDHVGVPCDAEMQVVLAYST